MALATRNVTTTKKEIRGPSAGLGVIIPAAGMGYRMKSHGPKALLQINKEYCLIERQLEIIWSEYPGAEIFVVVGFEAEKIRKRLLRYPVRIIYNPIHEKTNVLFSIGLALQASIAKEIMIVYGDLIFNDFSIRGMKGKSKILLDEKKSFKSDEVGLIYQNKKVTNFSFGLDCKWAQIAYLTGLELSLMEEISTKPEASQWLGYEALNYIIENGGEMSAHSPKNAQVFEIDTKKDLEKFIENQLTFG